MDSNQASAMTQLLIVVVLLLLSAFFSSAETALTTVNKMRVRTLAETGNRRAQVLAKVIENPGKLLSAILIGNNIVNLSASSLTTALVINLWGDKVVGVATSPRTMI